MTSISDIDSLSTFSSDCEIPDMTSLDESVAPSRDAEFFLEGSLVTIDVENVQFCLHSHFLVTQSEELKSLINGMTSPGSPLQLQNVTAKEFRALCAYFYKGMYNDYRPSGEEWKDLLMVAHTLKMDKIYRHAISKIDDLDDRVDPIERAIFAKRLGVEKWLAPAYAALCARPQPLTEEEAGKLGMYTFVMLVAARESYHKDVAVEEAIAKLNLCDGRCRRLSKFAMEESSATCGACGKATKAPTGATPAKEQALLHVKKVFWPEAAPK